MNPIIGTGGHGHTYPGATVPFGMVQLSPDTRIDGSWDGSSGYHYSDSVIYGFSHTHLNGTGVSDFGDIMLMPTMGEPSLDEANYSSAFSHASERASAGFYAVKLDKHNIKAELTASARVGFHQYTFNSAGQANVILDLNHRDNLVSGQVRIIDSKTIEVMRYSEGWAREQYVYARIEFSRPMEITKVSNNAFAPAKNTDKVFAGSLLALSFSSTVKKGDKIRIKVALSPTGFEGAKLNGSEIAGWKFDRVRRKAEAIWDNELAKIRIKEKNPENLTVFYTALYHTMIQPNIAQDLDGKYRGRDGEIHVADTFDYYSVFSLWDTFRAAHPLYTLIDKKRTADFVNTFLAQYEQGGRLPVWELASNETDCMIGYHSVSVMADAMAKGITGFNYQKAFEAAKHSAMLDHLGLDAYKRNGFISIDDEHESVSKTLEYAYDDWCIAQMASMLDLPSDYNYFMQRSQNWKNLFDPETTFIRPRRNGGWDKPFDPREVNNNYTEGNGWQYTFFVPHDVFGMVAAYGGATSFEARLDQMFSAPSATTGREQVDITGLIGQYAHGNEPSHHMAYLYSFVNKPEKAADKVQYILNNFYKNLPEGLIGNEDCGQMSAWYVLSSLGLYAVTPGNAEWTLTPPKYKNARVLIEGAGYQVLRGDSTDTFFGLSPVAKRNLHYELKLPVPIIEAHGKSFTSEAIVELSSFGRKNQRPLVECYKINDGPYSVYTKPVHLTASATISAFSRETLEGSSTSDTITATFIKKPNDYSIAIKSKYNPQYHAGGLGGLIDGIRGTTNWRKGDWQGYQAQDFEAVIDLREQTAVSEITAGFLQDSRSWILMPTHVEYYLSDDNQHFRLVQTVKNTIDPHDENRINDFKAAFSPVAARYVKVIAYNFGKLPEWHQGAGGDAFIFIDEISVN